RAKLAALRTSKAFARLKIQLQKQPARFAFKSAFAHFPSRLELQGRRKQCFRCHRPEAVPPSRDLQGPAMRPLLVARALRAPLSQNKIICDYPFPIAGSLFLVGGGTDVAVARLAISCVDGMVS